MDESMLNSNFIEYFELKGVDFKENCFIDECVEDRMMLEEYM